MNTTHLREIAQFVQQDSESAKVEILRAADRIDALQAALQAILKETGVSRSMLDYAPTGTIATVAHIAHNALKA